MAKILPKRYVGKVDMWLNYSGSKGTPRKFFAKSLVVSLLIAAVVSFMGQDYMLILFPVTFFSVFVMMHGFLALGVDRRNRYVDKILPDALQLMAANSRAGYIPSRALLLSARPEFGPLSEAIQNVGKEIVTGKPLEEAMLTMTRHIKSEALERTIKLILEGTKSGGQFAALLEETAEDLRAQEGLQKEMRANIAMYTIFVAFAGCLGAPVLYALSGFLTETLGKFSDVVDMPQAVSSMPFGSFGGVSVSPEFMFIFSLVAILITTIFGSLIIGLIGSGKSKTGIRYIPVLVIIALVVFFGTKYVISNVLSLSLIA